MQEEKKKERQKSGERGHFGNNRASDTPKETCCCSTNRDMQCLTFEWGRLYPEWFCATIRSRCESVCWTQMLTVAAAVGDDERRAGDRRCCWTPCRRFWRCRWMDCSSSWADGVAEFRPNVVRPPTEIRRYWPSVVVEPTTKRSSVREPLL